ncbi:glycosyltransferase family 39 protein [Streptomyces roseicoloratus]|uniref:glycosyltransferase family 39 protein n=1 Tax=Streptomyces roseicoloratus TaxID=2508722 RepID=UPI001FEA6DC4|nr:glycosyltransferase family 39 protein [Streptomyces roseicoloratus]
MRAALRHAAPALLGYLAVRLLGLVVLAQWAHVQGHGVWPVLARSWDSNWYLDVADHGYTHEHRDRLTDPPRSLAFFPLYPALVKAFAAVTPGSRASVGLVLAVLCSFAAAWGVFAVGDRLRGRRTGTLLAVLWGATPVAVVQWMGYTESLFTALTAWALYAVLTGRWAWAAGLTVAAGLTRPTGIALVAAVSVAGLLAARRRGGAAPLLAALAAPLGWLAYVGWVGVRVGRWDGYFAVQRVWGNVWDGGRVTAVRLRGHLAYDADPQLFLVVVSVVLIVSAGLYLLCLADRQPLPLLVFCGVLLLVVIGSGGVYFPRARFLVPGFPLLLPPATALARARVPARVLALTGAALSSAWLGAYMLLVWQGPP